MFQKLILAAGCSLVLAGAAQAEGDPEAGATLYAPCAVCHGVNGEGVFRQGGPKLAGQDGWYMKRQLQNFKNGIRGINPRDQWGMKMRPMAMTLADEQAIDDVVAYIETLEVPEAAE